MPASVCFVTPTYAPDLWRFALLRQSVRLFSPGIRHYALLDSEDFPMFQERFRDDPGVEFVVSRDLMPRRIEQRRLRSRSWQGALLRRIAWRTRMLPDPLNGWNLQQLKKLYFLKQSPAPNAVFLDSDMVLCAPVLPEYFFHGDALRLLEKPAQTLEDHAFDVCTHLLLHTPLQQRQTFYNYILQAPRFQRETAEALFVQLEGRSDMQDWQDRFMALPFPCEYNLLGYAARELQAYDGYFREPASPHDWIYDMRFQGDESHLEAALATCVEERGTRRVLRVQSTLEVGETECTDRIARMLAQLHAIHALQGGVAEEAHGERVFA